MRTRQKHGGKGLRLKAQHRDKRDELSRTSTHVPAVVPCQA